MKDTETIEKKLSTNLILVAYSIKIDQHRD